MRVLLTAAKQLKGTDGELRICSLNEVVAEVFDISGFTTIFKVFGSESEALDGFWRRPLVACTLIPKVFDINP